MKRLLLTNLLFIFCFGSLIYAQPVVKSIPTTAIIQPYKLFVGYNTTTVLIFPVAVIDGDRGYIDIIIQKQKNVQNVLNVKAAKKGFQTTNLHVYTSDGKVYPFVVEYCDLPEAVTLDVSKLTQEEIPPVDMGKIELTQAQLRNLSDRVIQAEPMFSRKTSRYEMKLRLNTIHAINDLLLFAFTIENHSGLDFSTEYTRLFIKDKKWVKRSSIQEQEINPLYTDQTNLVAGGSKGKFVIAVPRFTIPNKKAFIIRLVEENGGRHMTLRIKNRHLLKARKI